MDNDLMARRLRPPSEPSQAPQPAPQAAPSSPTQPIAMPAVTAEAPATVPWDSTAALAEVPWDRPADFAQPTDTVSADEPAWDKPLMNDWFEPEPVDDRTPDMFDTYADPAERPMAPPTPSWAAVEPTAVEPATEPTSAVAAPPAPEPVADPYDAFAPVLGDVSAPFAREWPESNGHDAGRNAPMLSAIDEWTAPAEATQEWVAEETLVAEAPQAEDAQAEWPQAEWEQTEWPQLGQIEDASPVQPAAVEPQTLEGTGLGPTPSADLFEWDPQPESEPDTHEAPCTDRGIT